MNQALLRQEIDEHFNREELRSLSFDMGIDYEYLPDMKEGMVRELILYCERREKLSELGQRLMQLRPKVDWEAIIRDESANGKAASSSLSWEQVLANAQRQHGRFWQAAQGKPGQPGIYVPDLYVAAEATRTELDAFLASEAAALIILGEPGVGKTNLLCQWTADLYQANYAVFYYDCGGSIQDEIETDVARDLGVNTPAELENLLPRLSELAAAANGQLVLIFDAINEFRRANQVGTAALLKQIDALVGRLPDRRVKVVLSCRTVPWRQMSNLGLTQLFWHRYFQPAASEESQLLLLQFDGPAFALVYARYQAYFNLQTAHDELPASLQERLRRPLLLRMLAEAYQGRSVPAAQDSLTLSIYQRYYDERVKSRRDQRFVELVIMRMYELGCSALPLDELEANPELRDEVLNEEPDSSYQRMLAAGILAELPVDAYQSAQVRFFYDLVGSYALARHLLRQPDQDGQLLARLVGEDQAFHLAWETAVIILLLRPETAVFAHLAQSQELELRELAVAGLVEYHADQPQAALAIIDHLLGLDSTEAHHTALKAAYFIGQAAQSIFLSVAANQNRGLRLMTRDALYLIWRKDPDFVNELLYALSARIELTAPRTTRYLLEFIIDLSVTIYINHCGVSGLPQQISDLYYELIKNRLHLDLLDVGILGPAFGKLVAKAVGSALAKPVMDTFQYTEIVSRNQLANLSPAEKERYKGVLNLVEPGRDLSGAAAAVAEMLQSPVAFINLLAAMPLAVHAFTDFAATEPLLQELFDEVNGHGRLWIILSLAVQIKETPPEWTGLLEAFTRRLISENPPTYYEERGGFLTHFDIVLVPLGLAYGKQGVTMPYLETLIETELAGQQWSQLTRTLTALGPVGLYYPQAVFHTLIAAIDDFNRPEIQDALMEPLSLMRILYLDEVDVFLQLIDAETSFKRRVAAAADIGDVGSYIYRLGMYNNAIYDALHHPKMRRNFLIGSLSVLIDKQAPQAFIAYYAETGIRMSREANYRLIEWTKPE